MFQPVFEKRFPNGEIAARVYKCSQSMARMGRAYHVVTYKGDLYCSRVTIARKIASECTWIS